MIILSIETSCDETAVSLIEASGDAGSPRFKILGNALHSQVETHAEFGGVFPIVAKREHAINLVPMLASCIEHAKPLSTSKASLSKEKIKEITEVLKRENGLAEIFIKFAEENEFPNIDAIAVTIGPGLEPALWVGISFAKALSLALDKPIIPVNHMEGHIVSVLMGSGAKKDSPEEVADVEIQPSVQFPALALLISGGHTELVHIEDWHKYKVLGATKDDAVGEAFDKVARLLSLPYPGGPKISKLAAISRQKNANAGNGEKPWTFPRPMIKSPDYDFSFSGLKTSVLYAVKEKTGDGKKELTQHERETLAEEFENAVTEVLVEKTRKALEATNAKTLILGGGVIANTFIRKNFETLAANFCDVQLFVPSIDLSTDNSIMIGIAGYLRYIADPENSIVKPGEKLAASGNLSL